MYLEVKNNSRTILIKEDNIETMSGTFDSCESDELILGGAVPAELKVSLFNEKDQFQDFKFYGSIIQLFNDNGKPLGKFVCSNPKVNDYIISLEANDFLANADILWSGAVFPLSEWELLLNICNQMKFSLAISKEDLICSDIIISSSDGIKGKTCRELIRFIAEANGMFAYMNGDGKLDFKFYDFKNIKKHISYSEVSNLDVEEVDTYRDGVRVDGDICFGGTSSQLEIQNNPIISNLSDGDIKTTCKRIYEKMGVVKYKSTNLETWDENNDLWLGDVYEVIDIRGNKVTSVVMQIQFGDSISYKGFGDTFEKKQVDAIEESNSPISSFDEEVDFGKTNNAMRINSKYGRFTICEKKVDNVSKFTRVFLTLSGRFSYTSGKKCLFEFYADNVKIKEFEVLSYGTQDFSYSFMADTRNAKSNVYSAKVVVQSGDEIDILPFGIELALQVKSGDIDDVQATDQLLVEKVGPFHAGNFTLSKLRVGNIEENVDVISKSAMRVWDISKAQNGTVMAYLMSSGVLYIYGDNENEMQAGYVLNNTYDWYNEYKDFIKKIVIRDCYDIAGGFVNDSRPYGVLKEVSIGSTVQVISDKAFNHDSKPNYIVTFENNVCGSSYIGKKAFYYGNVVADNLYFSYEELASVEITNEIVGTYEKIYATAGPTLGERAFQFCENLTGTIQFRAIKEIPQSCFEGCSKLWGVFIIHPVSVPESDGLGGLTFDTHITLSWSAFLNCENLGFVMCDEYNAKYSDFTFDVVVAADGSTFRIPDWGTFYGCPNIDRVFAPGVEELGTSLWGPRNYDIPNIEIYDDTGQLNFGNDNGDWDVTLVLDGNTKIATDELEAVKTNMYDYYRFTDIIGYKLI